MSWNKHLSRYTALHGGQFFGCNDSDSGSPRIDNGVDGFAFLEYRDLPVAVNLVSGATGGLTLSYRVAVSMHARLKGDYLLFVGEKNTPLQGIHIVLRQVDKESDAQSGEKNITSEHGISEVYRGRQIRTSDPGFTKNVLKDLELCHTLQAQPRGRIKVVRSGAEEGWHCVQASAPLGNDLLDEYGHWDLSWPEQGDLADREEMERRLGDNDFSRRLDALIHLAWAARSAVLGGGQDRAD